MLEGSIDPNNGRVFYIMLIITLYLCLIMYLLYTERPLARKVTSGSAKLYLDQREGVLLAVRQLRCNCSKPSNSCPSTQLVPMRFYRLHRRQPLPLRG